MERSLHFQYRRDYRANYEEMATLLGSTRLQPSEKELAFIADLGTGRYYSSGSIGNPDIAFLSAVVGATGATRAVEIGTASGVSASVIAAAMARGFEERGEALPPVLLDTIDRKDRCLFDDSKPIGFMVETITPELAPLVRIHTNGDATKAQEYAGKKELSFAFIDGNHQHPWPLIDALCLLPLMRPGAWMVMHDIDNPADRPAEHVRLGAKHVFQNWPGSKIEGGYIGAVQVPTDLGVVKPFVAGLLEQPFEVGESGWKRYGKQVKALAKSAVQ